MSEERKLLEERVEVLSGEVAALNRRVAQLAALVGAPELTEQLPAGGAAPLAAEAGEMPEPGIPEDASEELLTWAGRAALLPRLSTLCFLLVIALVLRTITDNGLVNALAGSLLGMGYAALVIAAGWYKYRRGSPLAPVFAACGAVLMFSIVVETHLHFAVLSSVPAYLLLFMVGVAMTALSHLFKVAVPVTVGALGVCLAGVAIDYPNPFFPYLAMLLLLANLLGFYASRIHRCSWLRWLVLFVTLFVQQVWAFKLGLALFRHEQPAAFLAQQWFVPTVVMMTACFLAIAVLGIFRSGASGVSRFDYSLPTINVVWAFASVQYVVTAAGGNKMLLGFFALTVAAGHLAAAFWLAGRHVERAPGTNSFAFAGAVLLALALPVAAGSLLTTLPLLSGLAFGLAIVSRNWQSGGVRATSYLFQIYAATGLVLQLRGIPQPGDVATGAVVAATLAAIGFCHYRWCRANAPPALSRFFSRYDKKDLSASLVLTATLVSGFFVLRGASYLALRHIPGDLNNSFRCAQTIIINGGAALLMLLAYRRTNKELRNVAVLITLLGAMKVFLYDLLGTSGLPRVLSIFSFGLAAALESLLLGRWQVQASRQQAGEEEVARSPSPAE